MPTLAPLLRAAYISAKRRTELLLLLAIFAGLLTSLFYTPALAAVFELVTAASETGTDDASFDTLGDQAAKYVPIVIMGQLALLAITGFLLPFWARAASPAGLTPWAKNDADVVRRGLLGFLHQLKAGLLTLISLVFIVMITSVLGFTGASGGFGVLLALVLGIWISVFFSAAANTAIIAAATDQKMTFSEAIAKNRIFLRPIVGSLAIIWFASIIADTIIESILTAVFEVGPALSALAFLKGALAFLVSALHISVLCQLPGFSGTVSNAGADTGANT